MAKKPKKEVEEELEELELEEKEEEEEEEEEEEKEKKITRKRRSTIGAKTYQVWNKELIDQNVPKEKRTWELYWAYWVNLAKEHADRMVKLGPPLLSSMSLEDKVKSMEQKLAKMRAELAEEMKNL